MVAIEVAEVLLEHVEVELESRDLTIVGVDDGALGLVGLEQSSEDLDYISDGEHLVARLITELTNGG